MAFGAAVFGALLVASEVGRVRKVSGVTMGWLLRLVTGGPLVVGCPDSSRVLSD